LKRGRHSGAGAVMQGLASLFATTPVQHLCLWKEEGRGVRGSQRCKREAEV